MAIFRPPTAVFLVVFTLPFSYAFAWGTSEAPPFFIFGDSVVDCGNNDYLFNSSSIADYLPYGIDFFAVTGRFTNARTIADVLGQLLGHEFFIPCANDPNTTGEKILQGVNLASAGTGILPNSTGGIATSLPFQIEHFAGKVLPELESQLGSNLSSYLDKAIFLFNTGGNDYIYDCFESTSSSCNIPDFTDYLVGYYTMLLKKMYGYGARKFAVFSTEVSGCTPVARQKNGGECNELYNNGSKSFNSMLNASVDVWMREMQGSQFVFVNAYALMDEILKDPYAYGFRVANDSCCEMGEDTSDCLKNGPVCDDRNSFVFFDGGHPTDAANIVLANEVYSSNRTAVTYPFNIMALAGTAPAGAADHSFLRSQINTAPGSTGDDVA